MNLYGLVPLSIGVYLWLYAIGKVGPRTDDSYVLARKQRLVPVLRWLSPLVVLYAVLVLARVI